MKCPDCETTMETGSVYYSMGTRWTSKVLAGTDKGSEVMFGGEAVNAWRCPSCGKIEMYSILKEK